MCEKLQTLNAEGGGMKLFAFILSSLFVSMSAVAAPQVECVAVSRSNDGKNVIEKAIPLTFDSNQFRKWETDIGQISFSVLFDKEREDFRLMITKGPDYMNGTALRGAFPKSGELRASLVSPFETHQIQCWKR